MSDPQIVMDVASIIVLAKKIVWLTDLIETATPMIVSPSPMTVEETESFSMSLFISRRTDDLTPVCTLGEFCQILVVV